MSWFLYSTILVPLGAKPYLCTSTDIEETPLTEKSKGGIEYLRGKQPHKPMPLFIEGGGGEFRCHDY